MSGFAMSAESLENSVIDAADIGEITGPWSECLVQQIHDAQDLHRSMCGLDLTPEELYEAVGSRAKTIRLCLMY